MSSSLKFALCLATIWMLAGCERSDNSETEIVDNTAEVNAYYADNPERFVFSTIEALPEDLEWQNGSDLPTFGDPRAKRGGQLRMRLNSMQQTLRVMGPDANGTLRGPLWSANMVQLIERHPWEDGFVPGLARAWAIDPVDPRKVYLKLDPDARWSDGKPFTIDDVFFSLYLLLSPNLNDPAINRVYDENFENVTRYDDETLSITVTKPSPDTLGGIATFILSQRDFYREFGEDYVDRYHWRFAPVTGAYTLDPETVKRGRRITFERLENWWADDKPFYRHRFNPDELTYLVIRDDEKAFESFLLGEIDWHALVRTQLWHDRTEEESFRNGYIDRAKVYYQLPAAREGVYINAMHPLLTDKTLRQGIQHAINYKKVNEGLYRGDLRRIRTFADGYGRYSHPTLMARTFDPGKAVQLFNEAGFIERDGDGILKRADGQRLSFVMTVQNIADEVTIATILKEEALVAGLELKLEVMDRTAYFTKTFEKNHQLAIMSWNTGYSPLPAFEWELRGADAGKPSNFNSTNIKDDELDAYLEQWDRLSDPVEAAEVSHRVQERIHDFAAWVPGLTRDYNRMGYWRWVKWPDYFQVPRYFFFSASGVFWIDEAVKEETLAAREAGRTFPEQVLTFDRWKKQ